jgi:hypothetical protein
MTMKLTEEKRTIIVRSFVQYMTIKLMHCTEVFGCIYQQGQCILFSVVFTPSLPREVSWDAKGSRSWTSYYSILSGIQYAA